MQNKQIRVWSILFPTLFWALNLVAQTDTTEITPLNLEDLIHIKVVSASKSNQTVNEAPANVIVISAKEIEDRGYRTLGEIMQDLPGFDFVTGQPAGEYPTHFLYRGMGTVGQTKFVIMLNGVPLNDISNGWTRNVGYNFVLEDVERVEFVSGPGSSLYGLNAYAGYINVITKKEYEEKGETNYRLSSSFLMGSYRTLNPEVYGWYKFKNNLAIQLSARYYKTEGDYGLNRYDPGNYFHNNYEPDSVMTSEYGMIKNETDENGNTNKLNDGFNTSINDYYVRGNLSKEDVNIGFSFWEKKEGLGSEVVGYEYFANTKKLDYLANHSGKTFNMNYKFDLTEKLSGKSKAYFINTSVLPETGFHYTYQYQSVDNGINPLVIDKKKTYNSEGFLFGFEQQLNLILNARNNIVAGVQFEQKIREYFNITIEDTLRNLIDEKSAIPAQKVYFSKNGAILLQDELKITKNILLNAGFRYDLDQFYGKTINPRVALVRNTKQGISYKMIYSQGFRAPTIFELYDEWRGNEKLLPEYIYNGETEVGYNSKKGFVLGNVFYSYMQNLILVVENPDTSLVKVGSNGQHKNYYQNVGNKTIFGFMIRTNYYINKSLNFQANYQYLGSTEELTNVAPHKINVAINYLFKDQLTCNVRLNWQSKTKAPESNLYYYPKTTESINKVGYDYVTEDNPDGYLDGHYIINITLRGKSILTLKKLAVEPLIIVRNLLNTQYAYMGRQTGDGIRPVDNIQSQINNPSGFIPAYHPQPGREVFLGLKFKL